MTNQLQHAQNQRSDTTVTFKMEDGADEGIVYEFQYGTEDAVDSDQNKLVETRRHIKARM